MTTLYRLAKLICLGIIAYSLWKISQKDFVANVTSDSPSDKTQAAYQDLLSSVDGQLNEMSSLRRKSRLERKETIS